MQYMNKPTYNFSIKPILIAAGMLAVSGIASANLIINGSFEANSQANGTWNVYNSLIGWQTAYGPGIELRNNVAGTASDGVNFVELDSHNFPNQSNRDANSVMYQTVTTQAGTWYDLMFDYSPRIDQPSTTNGINVNWADGGLIADVTGTGGSSNNWITYTFKVLGTGLDDLVFSATGTSDTLGGNIDNVRLEPSAVPLPTAAWLMVSAIGLFGFAANRKRI